MSSRTHQTYTRRWVNELQCPMFCIDYRLAPDHKYPAAIDDCWNAYNWIINHVHLFFNINPKKIILVGDSAGGNLVAALTLRCIKHGIRIPTGVMMAYPALYCKTEKFSPSLLHSLDDVILPHTFLKICVNAYVPVEMDAETDPFISPIKASNELLMHFPPTRIVQGVIDPFHDDSWRFLNRLRILKIDSKMIVYNDMPHGFLNYDVP